MKLLYCGPNHTDYALSVKKYVSLSALKWSRSFLSGIAKHAEISVITNTTEKCWPKGDVVWSRNDKRLFDQQYNCCSIGYPALPLISEMWLAAAYTSYARKYFDRGKIDAVICYNCMQHYHKFVMHEAKIRGIPTIPIVLDGDDPRPDNWKKLLHDTRDASAVAMLSYWIYRNFPSEKPKYHIDGGADEWNGGAVLKRRKPGPFRLVYTGALARWSGLDFFKGVIDSLKRENCIFIVCGRVEVSEEDELRRFKNVRLRGFVSEAELNKICSDADVFLNIRDPDWGDNILNYPSKLPHYLSYGKPVVSNALGSLSPDYDDVMLISKANTIEDFTEKIRMVMRMDEMQRAALFNKIKDWFLSNKLWDIQCTKFINWIERDVI